MNHIILVIKQLKLRLLVLLLSEKSLRKDKQYLLTEVREIPKHSV